MQKVPTTQFEPTSLRILNRTTHRRVAVHGLETEFVVLHLFISPEHTNRDHLLITVYMLCTAM